MNAGELIDRVRTQTARWPEAKRVTHGLDLLGAGDGAAARRRVQAKVALVSQDILIDLGNDSERYVLMKGLEVAQLYPSVVQRPSGDIDVLTPDPADSWHRLVTRDFRQRPTRRSDLDHHHLPALEDPLGVVGVELHRRPNAPTWAHISTDLVMSTAEPSRTEIPGILRPRDDIHALLLALHCWKGGFRKLRDLLDAMLLASVSRNDVESTAKDLGLARFWKWSNLIAQRELLGEPTPARVAMARLLGIDKPGSGPNHRGRVLGPYMVVNPIAVTAEHLRDRSLAREARR